MPTCALRTCNTRYGRKTEQVALFSFPLRRNAICQKWTQLVRLERGQQDWAPSGASKLCSKHFKESDIHISKTGRKVLKKGSVPNIQCRDFQIEKTKYIRTLQAFRSVSDTLGKNNDSDIELMFDTPEIELTAVDHYLKEQSLNQSKSYKLSTQKSTYYPGCKAGSCELKVCRICFSMDCQLLLLHDNMNFYMGYEAVTGQALAGEEDLPPYLCTDCALQLVSCIRFRNRCLEAHLMLLDIIKKKGQISLESIQGIKLQTPKTTDTDTEKEGKQTDEQNDKRIIDTAGTEIKMEKMKCPGIITDGIKTVANDVDTKCRDITTAGNKTVVNDADIECRDITTDGIKTEINDVEIESPDFTFRIKTEMIDTEVESPVSADGIKTEIDDVNMASDISTSELKTEGNNINLGFEEIIIKTEVSETKDAINERTEKGDRSKLDNDTVNPYMEEINVIVKQEMLDDESVSDDVDDR